MVEIEITSKQRFAEMMFDIARSNQLNMIDAITSYCEDNEVEMEEVIPLLDPCLKEQIRVDAINGRYVPGKVIKKLPFGKLKSK